MRWPTGSSLRVRRHPTRRPRSTSAQPTHLLRRTQPLSRLTAHSADHHPCASNRSDQERREQAVGQPSNPSQPLPNDGTASRLRQWPETDCPVAPWPSIATSRLRQPLASGHDGSAGPPDQPLPVRHGSAYAPNEDGAASEPACARDR